MHVEERGVPNPIYTVMLLMITLQILVQDVIKSKVMHARRSGIRAAINFNLQLAIHNYLWQYLAS